MNLLIDRDGEPVGLTALCRCLTAMAEDVSAAAVVLNNKESSEAARSMAMSTMLLVPAFLQSLVATFSDHEPATH